MAIGRRLLMFVQVRFECETLTAFAAPEALGGRMRLHMSAQVGSIGKRLVAQVATVGFLARVRSHVTLQ